MAARLIGALILTATAKIAGIRLLQKSDCWLLPGIIGTMMANEAIKIITGSGKVLSEKS